MKMNYLNDNKLFASEKRFNSSRSEINLVVLSFAMVTTRYNVLKFLIIHSTHKVFFTFERCNLKGNRSLFNFKYAKAINPFQFVLQPNRLPIIFSL